MPLAILYYTGIYQRWAVSHFLVRPAGSGSHNHFKQPLRFSKKKEEERFRYPLRVSDLWEEEIQQVSSYWENYNPQFLGMVLTSQFSPKKLKKIRIKTLIVLIQSASLIEITKVKITCKT